MLDRVKDKDYINVNLTYELDGLTKRESATRSGEWSLIAESIDPQRCANLSSSITLQCRSSLLHTLELANDEVALQERNAALFKEYLPLLQKVNLTIKQPVNGRTHSAN